MSNLLGPQDSWQDEKFHISSIKSFKDLKEVLIALVGVGLICLVIALCASFFGWVVNAHY